MILALNYLYSQTVVFIKWFQYVFFCFRIYLITLFDGCSRKRGLVVFGSRSPNIFCMELDYSNKPWLCLSSWLNIDWDGVCGVCWIELYVMPYETVRLKCWQCKCVGNIHHLTILWFSWNPHIKLSIVSNIIGKQRDYIYLFVFYHLIY